MFVPIYLTMGNGSSRTRVESAGDLTTIDDNNNSNANTISHDHNNQTAIELQLIEQQLNDLFRFKILLLGAGESGKSTVVKQLQLIHSKKKMQDKELSLIAQSLHSNVIDCMKALVHAATTFNYAPQFNDNDRNIINALFSHDENERITLDLCNALITLFNTQPIQLTYERRSEFWLLDSFPYCMQHLQRFCQTSFVPTEEDTVMARIRTTGIVVTELQHRIVAERPDEPNYLTYQVVDVGGQRNERKKWLHCFDNVTAIMFIVNLAGYNQVLFEDQRKNRMVEELELFSTITHNPLFADTPIMLFLNKKDLFETMIQQASLKKAFPHCMYII